MRSITASVAIVLAACEGASAANSTPPAESTPNAPVVTQDIDASRRTAITEATARVAPAVVTIQTETVERVPVDVFSMFFGGGGSTRQASATCA